MQHLSFILFQLDEARRYIEDGRPQHLRAAFLLLDNAVEIQMDRRIKVDMDHDDLMEKIRTNARSFANQRPQARLPQELRDLIRWIPLTRSEKLKLDRFFDEKVDYMVGRGGHLDASFAGPLKHLHKYRNEAYHRAKIRPETIRTAALTLLEINCQMLLTAYPGDRMFSSDEDYSWLEERFHYKPFLLSSDQLRVVVERIRSGLLPSDAFVAQTLAYHLMDRFSELHDSLDFIVENCGRSANKEEALRESEYYAECQRLAGQAQPPPAATFVSKYSIRKIRNLEELVSQVRASSSRVQAFARFAAVEKDFEPIEQCVRDLAAEIDQAIQIASDIARGK